jgi:hypothetical protein
VLRATLLLALVAFVFIHWGYVSEWLSSVTHGEGPGFKFDRVAADQTVREFSKKVGRNDFREEVGYAAVVRAAAVAPAISGALVLWVDPSSRGNISERTLMEDMGIKIRTASNTDEAINLANVEQFDLVISNLVRHDEATLPLNKCHAAYFEFPAATEGLRAQFDNNLQEFNAWTQLHPPAGFAMAERFAQAFPDHFADTQAPRIILYTAAAGGVAASACVRTVTNRLDILLQSVISALEELRWYKLLRNVPR